MPGIITAKTEEGWPILGYATIADTDGKVVRDSLELFQPRRVPDGFTAVPLVSALALRSAKPAPPPAPAPALLNLDVSKAEMQVVANLIGEVPATQAAPAAATDLQQELEALQKKLQVIETTAKRQLKLGINAVSASWLNTFIEQKG